MNNELLSLDALLQQYGKLGHKTQLHLGYAFRHQSDIAWRILFANNDPELDKLLELLQMWDYNAPWEQHRGKTT